MELLRKFRFLFYLLAVLIFFLMGFQCSFPKGVLKTLAQNSVAQFAVRLQGPPIVVPEVSISEVSLWRLSGVSLDELKLVMPQKLRKQRKTFMLESFNSRIKILPLLANYKDIVAYAELYNGDLYANAVIDQNDSLDHLHLDANELDTSKMSFIVESFGVPLKGVLKLLLTLNKNSGFRKDGTGNLEFALSDGIVGPGSLSLPTGGFMSNIDIPEINIGKLDVSLDLNADKLTTKTFKMTDGELTLDLDLTVNIGNNLMFSRLNGKGWFRLDPKFIEQNQTIKSLYELFPKLRQALESDGKVSFFIKGTLLRPRLGLM